LLRAVLRSKKSSTPLDYQHAPFESLRASFRRTLSVEGVSEFCQEIIEKWTGLDRRDATLPTPSRRPREHQVDELRVFRAFSCCAHRASSLHIARSLGTRRGRWLRSISSRLYKQR
jgi:hypothetical protein